MDKWDNREYKDSQKSFGSRKTILMLIGIMLIMWGMLGLLTYYGAPTNCDSIDDFIGSSEFYDMNNELRQKYIDVQYECNRDRIVVK